MFLLDKGQSYGRKRVCEVNDEKRICKYEFVLDSTLLSVYLVCQYVGKTWILDAGFDITVLKSFEFYSR